MPSLLEPADGAQRPVPDLRAVLLGVSAWAGGLAVFGLPGWTCLVLVALGVVTVAARRRRGRPVVTVLACLLAASAVGGVAALRVDANRDSPVAELARDGAAVTVTARVSSDPVVRTGRFGSYTLTRVSVAEVTGRGVVHRTRVPVLVIGDEGWAGVELGSRVTATGVLAPAQGPDLAGVLSTGRDPTTVAAPGELLDAAARVRAGIRSSVAWSSPDARALVPALVVGDDQQMSDAVVADFRTCGLTHLAAVSGTNLTLVVGFLVVLARWVGVRARGLTVVGVLGVVGFVLLARPEPSVLRAAAMGSVALVGMSARGRDTGVRALGVAVLVLLLLDPWLVLSIGFVLSSLATAGILFLGPPLPRRAAVLAAAVGRRGARRTLRGAAGLHAGGRRDLGPGQPGGGGRQPRGGRGRRPGDRAGSARRRRDPGAADARPGGGLGGRPVRRLDRHVATHLARLPTAALDWSAGPVSVAVLGLLCARGRARRARGCCAGAAGRSRRARRWSW